MKKIITAIDNKGNIVIDMSVFEGCLEEAQKFITKLKELGIEVEIKNVNLKQTGQTQGQTNLIKGA